MDIEAIKEELSISYLHAVCTKEGIAFELIRHDEDSTDAIIKRKISLTNGAEYESLIRVQLKATSSISQYSEDENTIRYKLKIKNYNDLRRNSTVPIILALLVLPENQDEWLHWTEQTLLLKGRMYWVCFKGADESDNVSTITVTIDKKQIVNPDALLALLQSTAEETV
ncbi:MAG: DUF4365 domain-containing protein [Acidaminococcaceae bacterium]|nr:DUF4365 domain-containing protein [Acidaminococcaceae bacterium]